MIQIVAARPERVIVVWIDTDSTLPGDWEPRHYSAVALELFTDSEVCIWNKSFGYHAGKIEENLWRYSFNEFSYRPITGHLDSNLKLILSDDDNRELGLAGRLSVERMIEAALCAPRGHSITTTNGSLPADGRDPDLRGKLRYQT